MNHVDREAPGPSTREPKTRAKNDVSDRQVVVLGSGNLGLIYLMEEKRRLSLEEIEERHPRLVRRARAAPSARRPARPVRSQPRGQRRLTAAQAPAARSSRPNTTIPWTTYTQRAKTASDHHG
jgi:hypothetical protein